MNFFGGRIPSWYWKRDESGKRGFLKSIKSFLSGLVVWIMVLAAQGQGFINFFNNSSTLVSTGLEGDPASYTTMSGAAGSYYFGLLTAPAGTTDPIAFTFSGVYATNQSAAGRFSGGTNIAVPGWAPGTTRAFMVAGWSAYLGPTWNPAFLTTLYVTPPVGFSAIAQGSPGGYNAATGQTDPILSVFGSATIRSGFMLFYFAGNYAPVFSLGLPESQATYVGSNATFRTWAVAKPPLAYQWLHDGNAVPGATVGFLVLTNVQMADAGTYQLKATNAYGTALSPAAVLTVVDSSAFRLTAQTDGGGQVILDPPKGLYSSKSVF